MILHTNLDLTFFADKKSKNLKFLHFFRLYCLRLEIYSNFRDKISFFTFFVIAIRQAKRKLNPDNRIHKQNSQTGLASRTRKQNSQTGLANRTRNSNQAAMSGYRLPASITRIILVLPGTSTGMPALMTSMSPSSIIPSSMALSAL